MLGFIFSLLVGALAGYIAGRIMGSETSTLRNIVLGLSLIHISEPTRP